MKQGQDENGHFWVGGPPGPNPEHCMRCMRGSDVASRKCEEVRKELLVAQMLDKPRGFAAIDRARLLEIAKKGGRASHASGNAHQFTAEEAKAAGKKGGSAPHVSRGKQRKPANELVSTAADSTSCSSTKNGYRCRYLASHSGVHHNWTIGSWRTQDGVSS